MLIARFFTIWRPLRRHLFEPRASAEDSKQREFIINVILSGLVVAGLLRILSVLIHHQPLGFDQEEDTLLANGLYLIIVIALWNLSRRGRQSLATFGILTLLSFTAIQLTVRYSFELPIAELLYALVIVVAGILLRPLVATIVTGLVSTVLIVVSYAQIAHYLKPKTDWVQQDFEMADVIGYLAVIFLIALVSWLTNREISHSLDQALASKAELAKERDNLEVKVAERTHELEQAHRLRILELQKFAEFGQVSACLIHEIANPLTAASLHLDLFEGKKSSFIVKARKNLQQLERYIDAARSQLKTQSQLVIFSVNRELQQVAQIMTPLVNRSNIDLSFEQSGNYKLYGDAIKFNQLAANLISNSIDAYEKSDQLKPKRINLSVTLKDSWLELTVTDWGNGIQPGQLSRLFEPFYTTKADGSRGTGIGLSTVKNIVEKDFHGNIKVTSSPNEGTVFAVKLKYQPTTG